MAPRRTFQTLEGLRTVGALLVATRHMPAFLGSVMPAESFLAVDLFYLLSGFVVAHAYEQRLQAGGFTIEFVTTRLIRLYPLLLLGLAAGAAGALVSHFSDARSWWTMARIIEAISAGLVLLPILPGMQANGATLDGPTWTLLPELAANFVYAIAIRFMSTAVVAAITLLSGVALIYAGCTYGSLDIGYGKLDLWAGLARVGFSFFAGVLLFRFFGDREHKSPWASWACLAALVVLLAIDPPNDIDHFYDLAIVMIAFPLLLIVAGRFEPGARIGKIFARLGVLSYGVYVLHQPLGRLLRLGLKEVMDIPSDWRAVAIGIAFLMALTALVWRLDRDYDAPTRRTLRSWLIRKPKRALTAA